MENIRSISDNSLQELFNLQKEMEDTIAKFWHMEDINQYQRMKDRINASRVELQREWDRRHK